MKKIKDEKMLQKAVAELDLASKFQVENLPLYLYEFEKGELLSGPHMKQEFLIFIVSDMVQIYGVGIDGRKIPVNLVGKGSLIGDVEFCNARNSNLFSETVRTTRCICIPIRETRKILEQDICFLHYLLKNVSAKVYLTSTEEPAVSVEERLLIYLKEECAEHTMKGVEQATLRLRCSRRQLQRTLKELCEQGVVEKQGKGIYRLRKGSLQ